MKSSLLLLLAALPLAASTAANFDSSGTAYTVSHAGFSTNPAQPTVMAGGPAGNFLRLAATPAVNLNTIAFRGTDAIAKTITADFDFRMTPPGNRSSAADGLGFVLLNS